MKCRDIKEPPVHHHNTNGGENKYADMYDHLLDSITIVETRIIFFFDI